MIQQPRYVVNRVTAGDYDCPRKVMNFLTDLHAAFRMLNLRNDFLRKKFDSKSFLFISSLLYLHLYIHSQVLDGDINLFHRFDNVTKRYEV